MDVSDILPSQQTQIPCVSDSVVQVAKQLMLPLIATATYSFLRKPIKE